jgi:alkaline phosphatase
MSYVDGFVIPIPRKNLAAYKKMASEGAKAWKKHGALEYFECVGDDLAPKMPGMKIGQFPALARARRGETVVFSFIVFKSKAHRDAVNKKVMKEMDALMKERPQKTPFDLKRMAYGGFQTIVQA